MYICVSKSYMIVRVPGEMGNPPRCAERSARCEPVPPGREDDSRPGWLTLTTGRMGWWAGQKNQMRKPGSRRVVVKTNRKNDWSCAGHVILTS